MSLFYAGLGAPTSGTSGTLVSTAYQGDFYQDTVNGKLYFNIGTHESPNWVLVSATNASGVMTVASGGVVPLSSNPNIYIGNNVPATATTGTDTACTNGTFYYGAVWLPANQTITGLSYLIGSVGGTTKAIAYLWDSTGAVVANSALAGTVVGTLATFQRLDFTAAYAAKGPAKYFAGLIFDSTTAKLRTQAFGDHPAAADAAGVFGTSASITPPTTFTASKAPYAMIY